MPVAAATPEPFVYEAEDDEEEYVAQPKQTASASEAAQLIRQLSNTLVALYGRYSGLHGLAKELNGLAESGPLPDHVDIKKIVVTYTVNGGGVVTAEVLNIQRVGEIGELLRAEIERLVDEIAASLTKIREISTASEQACNQAKFYTRMAQSKNVPS